MLSQTDKESIIKEFPNIKLSYENITHKKVYKSDYIVAIPEGIKCFAWFTTLQDKMVCLIMELSNNKEIQDIKIANACFSNELAYGTILYGTLFYHLHNKFFSIEDIFSYKGLDLDRINWGEKLVKINTMLKADLKQMAYNNSFLVFGLPIMCKTNEEVTSIAGYKIESIQYKLFNRTNNYLVMSYKNFMNERKYEERKYDERKEDNKNLVNATIYPQDMRKDTLTHDKSTHDKSNNNKSNNNKSSRDKQLKEAAFLVKPDIQADIYHLYCLTNSSKELFHSVAHIPNYDTSVMMNKLFRIIKENTNLDALEESDDEDEFENNNIDKFVHLDKSYKMICHYNHKFKKWVPIKIANEKQPIVSEYDIQPIYRTSL
jgi:hypothetical protein